ncbi:MAG: hypothetical protein JW932_17945 [Deltaproteobacteria bacterium]|nr:hypothetical protein [Deltaproteobacteria bacterium]
MVLTCDIKAKSPLIRMILMTGAEKDHIGDGLKAGNMDFVLFKPFRMKELKDVLGDAFSERRGM